MFFGKTNSQNITRTALLNREADLSGGEIDHGVRRASRLGKDLTRLRLRS